MFNFIQLFSSIDMMTVLLNHSAILHCQIETNTSSSLEWRFFEINQLDDVGIYKNFTIQEDYRDVIFALPGTKNHSDLFIPRTTYNFTGTYNCRYKTDKYELKLTILGTYI